MFAAFPGPRHGAGLRENPSPFALNGKRLVRPQQSGPGALI